jgi:hypothetical protein
MKQLFLMSCIVAGLAFPAYNTAFAADDTAGKGEMKKVCHPKKDKDGKEVKGKDGKVVEECKMVKVRKKLEGTEIPPAKK